MHASVKKRDRSVAKIILGGIQCFCIFDVSIIDSIYVTGGRFESNGTTSVPKSVPFLMMDKIRLLYLSELFYSSQIKVTNKSLSQELKKVIKIQGDSLWNVIHLFNVVYLKFH